MNGPVYTAQYWITKLDLQAYPNGGYFRETYRAAEGIAAAALPERFSGPHAFSTAIYFLLEGQQVSQLHRLKADEVWHFYAGSALTIHLLHPDGRYTAIDLGPDAGQGEAFQAVVPAGCWFGAALKQAEGYALVGCTVAPGFEISDYQPADRQALLARYPDQRDLIERL